MYIGEVAAKTDLSVKAIRFYEEKGLIVPLPRKGRYRVYDDSHIEILKLIKEAKSLGATLAQLKGAIIYQNGEVDLAKIGRFLEEIRGQLLAQINALQHKVASIGACLRLMDSPSKEVDSPL